MKTAYSYARFSSAKQGKGDSFRRQTEWAQRWCEEHDYCLDTSLKADKGVSAFKGKNSKSGHLADFLRDVEEGHVEKGSVLLVENVDRLTRQALDEGTELVKKVLRAGITIVTREPAAVLLPEDRNDLGKVLQLTVWISRGHEEQKTKGDRVHEAKNKARSRIADGVKMTAKGPAWLKLSKDRKSWTVIPERVEVVRKIFRYAAAGFGHKRILRALFEKHVPSFYRSPWNRSGLAFLLKSRAVIGEFQPCIGYGTKKDRKPTGDPIPDYYPAIIDKELFYRVQDGLTKRLRTGSRDNGRAVGNLFTGIIRDGLNGLVQMVYNGQSVQLVSNSASNAQAASRTAHGLPYHVFESAFLGWTKELRAKDILPAVRNSEGIAESISAAEGRLADINDKIERIKRKILGAGDVETLSDMLVALDKEKKSTTAIMERLRASLHSSTDVSLEQTQELISLLATKTGDDLADLRQRVKNRIRSLVSEIRLLVTSKGQRRQSLVQVFFEGGKRRSFLIDSKPIRSNQTMAIDKKTGKPYVGGLQAHYDLDGYLVTAGRLPGRWLVVVTGEKELDERRLIKGRDLRIPADAATLAEALAG